MSPEIVAAFIAGIFSLLAVIIALIAERNVRSLRSEFLKGLFADRLKAYRVLWEKMAVVAPTRADEITKLEREGLESSLRNWYYDRGNGLFLSVKSQRRFLMARKVLRGEVSPADEKALIDAFSELRTALKNDLGVYGRAESRQQVG